MKKYFSSSSNQGFSSFHFYCKLYFEKCNDITSCNQWVFYFLNEILSPYYIQGIYLRNLYWSLYLVKKKGRIRDCVVLTRNFISVPFQSSSLTICKTILTFFHSLNNYLSSIQRQVTWLSVWHTRINKLDSTHFHGV